MRFLVFTLYAFLNTIPFPSKKKQSNCPQCILRCVCQILSFPPYSLFRVRQQTLRARIIKRQNQLGTTPIQDLISVLTHQAKNQPHLFPEFSTSSRLFARRTLVVIKSLVKSLDLCLHVLCRWGDACLTPGSRRTGFEILVREEVVKPLGRQRFKVEFFV
ncbi:hypothetical protein BDZ45DRAFT_146926 [Acephala macrosclerotiorum]|nr:hypothetical protein BDZ45DRAFT_146926 [Acephala macrosclerotiorum]